MDTTINKLLDRERARVLELKERLLSQCQQFEEAYSLASTEFYTRYEQGEMGDAMDFVEWAATVEMLTHLNNRLELPADRPDRPPGYGYGPGHTGGPA